MAKRARQEGAAGGRTVASLGWPMAGLGMARLAAAPRGLGRTWCAWALVWVAPGAPGRTSGLRLVQAWLAWVRLGAGLARLGAPGLEPRRYVARWSRAKKPWRARVASWAGSLARGSTAAGLGRGSSADRKGGRRWAQSAPAVGGKEGFGERDGEGREKVKEKRRKEASRS